MYATVVDVTLYFPFTLIACQLLQAAQNRVESCGQQGNGIGCFFFSSVTHCDLYTPLARLITIKPWVSGR